MMTDYNAGNPIHQSLPATHPVAASANGQASSLLRPAPKTKGTHPHTDTKDSVREIVETVVFVVVLVLLLKSFVAEAFVIPTGSMAETLYGYQKVVDCPECQYKFPVNCSSEVEDKVPVRGCVCPNCRFKIAFTYAESTNLFEIQDDALVFSGSSKESQSFQ